jgi:hypothetical protein
MSLPWLETEKWGIRLLPEGQEWKISTIETQNPVSLPEEMNLTTLKRTEYEGILSEETLRKWQYMILKIEGKALPRIKKPMIEAFVL